MSPEADQPYPKHLFDPIRLEIASMFIKREFRKKLFYFRGPKNWQAIDRSIDTWFAQSLRDFWNSFHAIAMGFELKNGFVDILTAENVKWRFVAQLPLDNKLASGGPLTYIHENLTQRRPRALHLKEFFNKSENKDLAEKWLSEFRKVGSRGEPRSLPIIVAEEVDGDETIYSTYDGNRRMVLMILQGRSSIPAYVGKYTTQDMTPQNFWLPTSFSMDYVRYRQRFTSDQDYQLTLRLLNDLAGLSEGGKYEIINRVLVGENKFRMNLKIDLQ